MHSSSTCLWSLELFGPGVGTSWYSFLGLSVEWDDYSWKTGRHSWTPVFLVARLYLVGRLPATGGRD